jgi:hypothetical protein
VFHKNQNIKKKQKDAKLRSDPSTLHVAHLRHPKGCRVQTFELTRVRTSASGQKNAPPGATETWETLEEMGLVVGQVLVRMSKARNNMVLMSIDSVLVLLVLTHICARGMLNLELLPQFNWRIPLANCAKDDIGIRRTCTSRD